LGYVTEEDSRLVVADGKPIDPAKTLPEAEPALEKFAAAGDAKEPTSSKRWRPKWRAIVTLFDFPEPIRKAIDTTNAIESVNRVIRTFTRNRQLDPNAEAALKGGRGDPRSSNEVDDADPPRETGTQRLRHPLRGPIAPDEKLNSAHAVPRAKSTKFRTGPAPVRAWIGTPTPRVAPSAFRSQGHFPYRL
jgi:hypothetical protein